jgi:hypothetical protein
MTMHVRLPRFRVRTLMVVALCAALLMAAIEYRARNMSGVSEWRAYYVATVATLTGCAFAMLGQIAIGRFLSKAGKPK